IRFSESETPKPLIVSLHTWSGDYTQKDPLIDQILKNDWNYIHPDFRGVNNKSKACGSTYVISDIDDAISYAIKNANVDPANIHVIGVSGGGFATMLAYMQSKHNIRTFSAWVGISNLVDWYYESLGRKNKYASHIALATTGDTLTINVDDAISRSPVFMNTPVEQRKNSKLFLYTGIHDGYTGSVPITQTIDFYNKVVSDWQIENTQSKVSDEVKEMLLRQRILPVTKISTKLGDRKIHYQNSFQNKVYLSVFEGGHEMIIDGALSHIPTKSILALGDSNGAAENGWVNQLKNLRPNDFIINTSVSGNTIGFDNLNSTRLNTLEMLDSYLQKGIEDAGRIDYVVILLGTNDCKAIFADRLKEIPENFKQLITSIQKSEKFEKTPEIIVVSPPPYGPDEVLLEKYKCGAKRVSFLTAEFKKVAQKMNVEFIDIHTPLQPVFDVLSPDGVHLSEEGQKIIAKMINEQID
ncbi:GDSL-type esterase/lipase family protein, partial [Draconibacterium sp.]|nr:GDSL-type esterase/lipase family protein [Draconibacterium sp.]